MIILQRCSHITLHRNPLNQEEREKEKNLGGHTKPMAWCASFERFEHANCEVPE